MTSSTIEYASHAPDRMVAKTPYPRLPSHSLIPSTGKPDYLRLILTSKVYDILKETPLSRAPNLSARFGNEIWLKREDLQEVFSFKIRGAYNFMANLGEEERWKGVVTCSAGNHAQGVALSGSRLNVPCTIVMPKGTPSIKVRNVQRLGAKVVLHGDDFDEAKIECARLAEHHGLVFVPPYDDPLVIAGQGTVGMEILKQMPDSQNLDAIFAAVGGGGLVAGTAEYVKRIGGPKTQVIGVETVDGDAMAKSLDKGERVTLPEVGPFSDGTAVKIVGEEPFRVCKELLDGVVKTNNDEICAAIKDIFEETRSVTEPAGALALAGLKHYMKENNLIGAGKKFVVVVSGANMNFGRLRFVAERAELGEGKEVLMSVEIPEEPGAFIALHEIIWPRDVTEFVYRYNGTSRAHIVISFILQSPLSRAAEVNEICSKLRAQKMDGQDISDNELAKSHVRYLVGGRTFVPDERLISFGIGSSIIVPIFGAGMTGYERSTLISVLYPFSPLSFCPLEFPERPGALRKFLLGLQSDWNISLWHYRNYGADVAKVLVGVQVPQDTVERFEDFLSKLAYNYLDETNNPVFRRFLFKEGM